MISQAIECLSYVPGPNLLIGGCEMIIGGGKMAVGGLATTITSIALFALGYLMSQAEREKLSNHVENSITLFTNGVVLFSTGLRDFIPFLKLAMKIQEYRAKNP